jgi:hypothetical protein
VWFVAELSAQRTQQSVLAVALELALGGTSTRSLLNANGKPLAHLDLSHGRGRFMFMLILSLH